MNSSSSESSKAPNTRGRLRKALPPWLIGPLRGIRDFAVKQIRQQDCQRRWANLRSQRKIVYLLTPPPQLSNIGDHAQVVAIRKWLQKYFPDPPVLEADKIEVIDCINVLKEVVGDDDLILLHSGGNLGDRGVLSERGRRLAINSFPSNRIISLPQTIYFSDTITGRRERTSSQEIYAQHPNLVILARDPVSRQLAETLFPSAEVDLYPDFVLSLVAAPRVVISDRIERVLLCLRRDSESTLSEAQKLRIQTSLPFDVTIFDTTLPEPIHASQREERFDETIRLFQQHDAIITDRLHGLIFAVLSGLPTVVLPTVDHKLTSSLFWFRNIPFIRAASTVDQIPLKLKQAALPGTYDIPDWKAQHFERLAAYITEQLWNRNLH